MTTRQPPEGSIGTYGESSLHADLKRWYAQNGDQIETEIEGYIIDLVRGDLLIEIQTRHFTALKGKLNALLPAHTIRLVHPIAAEKWIVRHHLDEDDTITRRRSPKRGQVYDVFRELVRIPTWLQNPNLQIEVLLTHQEEHLANDGQGSWRRRGWRLADRHLLEVQSRYQLSYPGGYLDLLPASLPEQFTTKELAEGLHIQRSLAQKMSYTLHRAGLLQRVARQGPAWVYRLAELSRST